MKKIRLGTYPYTFARVSAMKSKLIGKEQYLKLLKMKPIEITRFLEETEYKKQIDELAVNYSGVDLIERALNKNLAETFDKLRRISDEKVNILINTYLKRWDIHDIKTILRGIANKSDKNYIESILISAGVLSRKHLMKMFETGDIDEVLKSIHFMPMEKFQDKIEEFEQNKNLFEIENELDRMYYQELLDLAKNISGHGKPFATFLEREIDNLNLKTILRLKKKGFEKEQILTYMILSGAILNKKLIEKLIVSEDPKEILKRTHYSNLISDSLAETELELDKFLIHRSFLSVHQMPLTITAIMSYLLVKEIEAKNIKSIIKAKQLGIDEKFIEEKLVV